jgi:hypothetical protein
MTVMATTLSLSFFLALCEERVHRVPVLSYLSIRGNAAERFKIFSLSLNLPRPTLDSDLIGQQKDRNGPAEKRIPNESGRDLEPYATLGP